ncbi:myelin-associated neurite-outgrowth inhibitor [Arapaima gigas]
MNGVRSSGDRAERTRRKKPTFREEAVPIKRTPGDKKSTVNKPLHHEPHIQSCTNRGVLRKSKGDWIPRRVSCGLHCCPCLYVQHLPRGKPSISNRLLFRHAVQNVVFSNHGGRPALFLFTQSLPDSSLPHAEFLPPAESVRTGKSRHLLYTATVCCTAPRHSPHYGGPAQRDASCHVPPTHCSASGQRGFHGRGHRGHHGNVSWDVADNSLPNSGCPSPCHDPSVPTVWHTSLQLHAPLHGEQLAVIRGGRRSSPFSPGLCNWC